MTGRRPEERERRDSFEGCADEYLAVRPGYPVAMFDALEELAELRHPSRILEVGCGPGIATRLLAARGHSIHAIELSTAMAATARRNLAGCDVTVTAAPFEEASFEHGAFDLVAASQSWHWIPPARGAEQAALALRGDGSFAAWWNFEHGMSPDLQACNRKHAPELLGERTSLEERHERRLAELNAAGAPWFGPLEVRRFPWTREIDAGTYARLVMTYSDHAVLPVEQRRRLGRALAERIEAAGGLKHELEAILYVARKR